MANGDPMVKPAYERHFQSFIGIIVIGVMGWVGYNVNESAKKIVALDIKVETLQEQIDDIEEGTRNRYTKQDATRDFELRDSNINSLLQRIDRLEQRMFFEMPFNSEGTR